MPKSKPRKKTTATRRRPEISADTKRRLIAEAGGKCASPGCPVEFVEFHHINEWAVYQEHDPDWMICFCPTHHSYVDRGRLRIDKETAKRWKTIVRDPSIRRGHMYVEPADTPPALQAGGNFVETTASTVMWSNAPGRELSFRLVDEDHMEINALIADVAGIPMTRVRDGRWRKLSDECDLAEHPGHIRVTRPLDQSVMPTWAQERVRDADPDFCSNGTATLLDLEVTAPNVVRVEGIWMSPSSGLVITPRAMIGLMGPFAATTVWRGCHFDYAAPEPAQLAFVQLAEQGRLQST